MSFDTAAGSKVYIGHSQPSADPLLASYEGDTYVEVGEVGDLGNFGDTANIVNFTSLSDRRVRKRKGSYDAGTMALTCASDPQDPGQLALIAALANDLRYNFKVVLDDKLTESGVGTTLYFGALVASKQRQVGNAESVLTMVFNVAIDTPITEVEAT
jgi:hypothetical protein